MKRVFLKTNKQYKAMVNRDHFKNGASSRRQTRRGNLILLVFLFLLTLCTYDKVVHENKEELPNYIAIENFGEQFELAILGLDGLGYFYEFQEEKFIPKRLTIYDGNKEKVGLIYNFDEKGLPKNILSEEFTIALGNFSENRFDAVVVTPNGESYILEKIETDISWDEYPATISEQGKVMASAPSVFTRGLFEDIMGSVISSLNIVSSAVACGVGIGLTTTGAGAVIGIPLAVYGCSNTVLYSVEYLDQIGIIDYDSPQWVENIRNYGGNMFQKCVTAFVTLSVWSATGCMAEIIKLELELFEDHYKNQIRISEGIMQTGRGHVKITLVWDNYADIDLHCIDPSGVHIYFRNKYSYATGGFLDYDNTVALGPENIYFSPAPDGTYRVYIHYYASNNSIYSVNYMVAIFQNGTGRIYEGTISEVNTVVEIDTFTLGEISTNSTSTRSSETKIDWNNLEKK